MHHFHSPFNACSSNMYIGCAGIVSWGKCVAKHTHCQGQLRAKLFRSKLLRIQSPAAQTDWQSSFIGARSAWHVCTFNFVILCCDKSSCQRCYEERTVGQRRKSLRWSMEVQMCIWFKCKEHIVVPFPFPLNYQTCSVIGNPNKAMKSTLCSGCRCKQSSQNRGPETHSRIWIFLWLNCQCMFKAEGYIAGSFLWSAFCYL